MRASVLSRLLLPLPDHENRWRRRVPTYFMPWIGLQINCRWKDSRINLPTSCFSKVRIPFYLRYTSLLLKTYVDDRPTLKWCPFPSCEKAVQCKIITKAQLEEIVPTVTCAAGHRFCFGCGLSDHQPVTCMVAKKWLKKCQDDSETSNWIAANTKECPKCNSTIEKNGGCNHMT